MEEFEVRCNNCMTYFKGEEELELIEEGEERFLGCPNCKTDAYLMDLE